MADEAVTDLTEAESGEGGAQQEKGKKPPKEKKEKAPKGPRRPGEKRPSNGIMIILILLAIAIVLIGGYTAALIYDVFSARAITSDFIRDPAVNFLVWLDPTFNMIDEELRDIAQAREDYLNAKEEGLKLREEEVIIKENLLLTQEGQLDRLQADLQRREEAFQELYERHVPKYARDMTPEEIEEMESIAQTFRRMAPDAAARVLYEVHTIEDVATILYFMDEKSRGAIMTAFQPDYAGEVTNIWIYN